MMSVEPCANLETGKLYAADFNKLSEENQNRVLSTESFLDALEANINSDLVSVPVFDAYGNITKETRLMSMSQAMQGVVRSTPDESISLSVSEPKLGDDAHSAALKQFEEAKRGLEQKNIEKHEAAHAVQAAATPASTLEHLGLAFLSDPPSQPSQSVKLQLSGPVKFGTTIHCHTCAVTDHLVVLVTDSRVKGEIIDLSLEDSSATATLILDEQTKVDVYPPIPAILTYDIGVLRHFLFIRKHGE